MTELKWEEPPPRPPTRVDVWQPIFDALRTRPNQWALVREETYPSLTTDIQGGNIGDAIRGEFEARSTRVASGKFNIYARYVGVES